MTVGTLLTVFGLLTRGAAAMSTGDILLFLSLGLHLPTVAIVLRGTAEHYASTCNYIIYVTHNP